MRCILCPKKYLDRESLCNIGKILFFLTLQRTIAESSFGSSTLFFKPLPLLIGGGKDCNRSRRNTAAVYSSKTENKSRESIFSPTTCRMSSVRGGERSSSPQPSDKDKIQLHVDMDMTNIPGIPMENLENNTTKLLDIPMNFAFSDVDGTLVHYPPLEDKPSKLDKDSKGDILYLPPSSTGMRGVISSETLRICQILRKEQNVKFVLVSGMRTSTLLKRLPYLPKADAYASEAGGRIFYPVTTDTDLENYDGKLVKTVRFNGATSEDLREFGLVEDMEWRRELSMDSAAGTDGYIGDVMNEFLNVQNEGSGQQWKPIKERGGALWNFAKDLESEGFVLDYKGYSCCFRVNWKHQNEEVISREEFELLSLRDVSELGLATSVNLGCVDFYPINSGKKNCCSYLARRFLRVEDSVHGEIIGEDILLKRAICFCDDDNDLEMASACGRVYLPSVSSKTMEDAVRKNPEKIIVAEDRDRGIVETQATENALLQAIEMYRKMSHLRP